MCCVRLMAYLRGYRQSERELKYGWCDIKSVSLHTQHVHIKLERKLFSCLLHANTHRRTHLFDWGACRSTVTKMPFELFDCWHDHFYISNLFQFFLKLRWLSHQGPMDLEWVHLTTNPVHLIGVNTVCCIEAFITGVSTLVSVNVQNLMLWIAHL